MSLLKLPFERGPMGKAAKNATLFLEILSKLFLENF